MAHIDRKPQDLKLVLGDRMAFMNRDVLAKGRMDSGPAPALFMFGLLSKLAGDPNILGVIQTETPAQNAYFYEVLVTPSPGFELSASRASRHLREFLGHTGRDLGAVYVAQLEEEALLDTWKARERHLRETVANTDLEANGVSGFFYFADNK